MRPEEWAVLQVCAVIVLAALLAFLVGSPVGLIIGAVLGWLLCRFFLRTKTARRAKAFEDQLPDTLQLIAGSLRSGSHSASPSPGSCVKGQSLRPANFARALAEVRLGSELEEAIDDVAERMECQDLHWVVLAIRISREVGGNLAEVLGNTVTTMRQRAELRGLVKVLSAEGRISARVLVGLPIFVTGFLLIFRPGYLNPLFHSATGIAMLMAGVLFLALGSFWLSRLVKIEV